MLCLLGPPRAEVATADSPLEAELARVEEDLLAAFGARWDAPVTLPAGWASHPRLRDLRERTAARLREVPGTHVVRGDPRAALFLPFWDAVATVDGVALVLVPPDDAVHHLVEDEGLAVETAADLWVRYVVRAWTDAPTRTVVTIEELREDSEAVVERLADLGDGGYDPDEVRHALAVAASGLSDVDPAPRPTVGKVIGGPSLDLARAVHRLVHEGDDATTGPLLAAIADRWTAERRAEVTEHAAAAASDLAETEHERAEQLERERDALRDELDHADARWGRTARSAIVGEGRARQGVQYYRGEAERIKQEAEAALREAQDRLDAVNHQYERLRGRRLVRAALSAAELAKPLFRAVRRVRKRQDGEAKETEQARPADRVFTVVLNYRHVDDTLGCLAALADSGDRHQFPVVVDNGSGEEDLTRLRDAVGARPLIAARDNLGYAAGNNLGVEFALERDAEFVWLLNPDARVEHDTLAVLLRAMHDNPDAGIVGARLLNGGSDPLTIASDGGIVDWSKAGATDHVHVGEVDAQTPAGEPHPVDYVPGACMLVRRAVFEDVGYLPEAYFLYFEETDFNLRAAAAGWRVLVAPRARVHHHKRSSGRVPAPYYVYYFVRNRLAFTLRHVDGWDPERVPPDLEHWLSAWHDRVTRNAPHWVQTFEDLVERALADARAGVSGRREDIEAVPAADETRDEARDGAPAPEPARAAGGGDA